MRQREVQRSIEKKVRRRFQACIMSLRGRSDQEVALALGTTIEQVAALRESGFRLLGPLGGQNLDRGCVLPPPDAKQ